MKRENYANFLPMEWKSLNEGHDSPHPWIRPCTEETWDEHQIHERSIHTLSIRVAEAKFVALYQNQGAEKHQKLQTVLRTDSEFL